MTSPGTETLPAIESMRRLFEVSTIAGMASYVENALWLRQPAAEESAGDTDDFEEIEL